jgi:hypothetical protein
MQPNVGALIILDVDSYLCTRLQVLAGSGLIVFQIGPDDIVGFARGHALGEFAMVVGKELPVSFLLIGAADLHFHSIDCPPVRIKYRSEDQRGPLGGMLGLASLQPRKHKQRSERKDSHEWDDEAQA